MSITIAVILIASLYFFGNTIPPKKDESFASTTAARANAVGNTMPASFELILKEAKTHISQKAADKIDLLSKQIDALHDSLKMISFFDSLSTIWEKENESAIAANYSLLAGKFGNSEKKLTFAAQIFLKVADSTHDEAVRSWEAMQAMFGFQQVLVLNANNETAKVGLAQCYLGTGQTMQGVLMLRDVAEKNPENLEANLLLGQQGIVSGQMEKAQARFEKVLKIQPKNVEAILGLAEVFKSKGDKPKAIELLQQAKKIMNNPEFSKDIEQYISTF